MIRIFAAFGMLSFVFVVSWGIYLTLRDSRCEICHREWAIFMREDLTICRRCRRSYDARMRVVRGPRFFFRFWP